MNSFHNPDLLFLPPVDLVESGCLVVGGLDQVLESIRSGDIGPLRAAYDGKASSS
jgi:hypothetical protein